MTEALVDIKDDGAWNLEIFPNRDEALNWLVSQQGKLKDNLEG